QSLEEVEPRLSLHADVGDEHVRRILAQRTQCRLGRLERPRQHPRIAQRALEHPPDRGIVVDQPDAEIESAQWFCSSRGSISVKMVRPGSLSNSMRPPWRMTRSCATASPRP